LTPPLNSVDYQANRGCCECSRWRAEGETGAMVLGFIVPGRLAETRLWRMRLAVPTADADTALVPVWNVNRPCGLAPALIGSERPGEAAPMRSTKEGR
jgi:hypothetical protein